VLRPEARALLAAVRRSGPVSARGRALLVGNDEALHDGRVLHAVTLVLEDIEGSGGRVFHPATTISDPLTWRSEVSQCGEGAEWPLQASVFRGKRSGATFADAPIGGHVVLSRDS
jgi:hypothetical protein